MKLPSIDQVLHDARSTFLRFPLVICDALIGTVAALLIVDHEGEAQPTVLFPIMFASILGIALLVSLQLVVETRKWKAGMAAGVQVAGILLLIGYGILLPQDFVRAPGFHLIRFFILAAALHLFVAVGPFSEKGELNGFWHYNKTLFIRALTALLYTGVLWVGLAIALGALDNLFGVTIPGKRYPELWIVLNGIFCTWFFLAGVPQELHRLEASTEYPKGLKIFAQYVLLPILLVYLVILYAYFAKVVIAWDWPQGWASKLILGFAGTGIFSLLLLHPISNRTDQVWIKTASRWFYVVLAPLLVMLFLAVWRRVSEYGLTEGRYMAFAVGIWLVGMVAYFTFSRIKSIKVLPATLCILLLVVSFGPWSTFAIPEGSQVSRLKTILAGDSILVDSKIRAQHAPVSFEDSKQISSIVQYLHDQHGYNAIEPWFGESLKADTLGKGVASLQPAAVMSKMGLDYVSAWHYGGGRYVLIGVDREAAFDIRDFDSMVHGIRISAETMTKEYPQLGFSYRVGIRLDTITFVLAQGNNAPDTLQVDLRQIVDAAINNKGNIDLTKMQPDLMSSTVTGRHCRLRVIVRQALMNPRAAGEKGTWYDLDVLYASGEVR